MGAEMAPFDVGNPPDQAPTHGNSRFQYPHDYPNVWMKACQMVEYHTIVYKYNAEWEKI